MVCFNYATTFQTNQDSIVSWSVLNIFWDHPNYSTFSHHLRFVLLVSLLNSSLIIPYMLLLRGAHHLGRLFLWKTQLHLNWPLQQLRLKAARLLPLLVLV